MSHYSDDREYEENERRKRESQNVKKALRSLDSFRTKLSDVGIPKRFYEHLEDLENYMRSRVSE